MENSTYKVIFIIGPPGAGKNTQCDLLIKKYGFIHLGAGDLLRAEAKKDTEDGKLINSLISKGDIVPVRITCGLIKKEMENKGMDHIYIIDGYPRNLENITGWKEVFGDKYKLITSINLIADEKVLTERLVNRSKNSGRSDDDINVIKHRFEVHNKNVNELLPDLKAMGPYFQIDGTKSPDLVCQEICNYLDKKLK